MSIQKIQKSDPLVIFRVGSEDHPASQKDIQDFADHLREAQSAQPGGLMFAPCLLCRPARFWWLDARMTVWWLCKGLVLRTLSLMWTAMAGFWRSWLTSSSY